MQYSRCAIPEFCLKKDWVIPEPRTSRFGVQLPQDIYKCNRHFKPGLENVAECDPRTCHAVLWHCNHLASVPLLVLQLTHTQPGVFVNITFFLWGSDWSVSHKRNTQFLWPFQAQSLPSSELPLLAFQFLSAGELCQSNSNPGPLWRDFPLNLFFAPGP